MRPVRPKILVKCSNCKEAFLKFTHHLKESVRFEYKIFCCRRCYVEYKSTGKTLICENRKCAKLFYRNKASISKNSFCSRSCAAIINNQRYPKWPPRRCKRCSKQHNRNDSPYCSVECGKAGRFTYTEATIISLIQSRYKELGRVPAKREAREISHKAANQFGTWNKAIEAAGLKPNRSDDNRMYHRTKTKAQDGHVCDSISEALIDNWLSENNIPHERNVGYPTTGHRSDWAIRDKGVFIEYFGLAQDSPRYDQTIKQKQQLCKKLGIKLIEIYPQDLYPANKLATKIRLSQ